MARALVVLAALVALVALVVAVALVRNAASLKKPETGSSAGANLLWRLLRNKALLKPLPSIKHWLSTDTLEQWLRLRKL